MAKSSSSTPRKLAGRDSLYTPPPDPWLAPAKAAPESGRALSTFWRDVKSGVLPPPAYLGPRLPRWRRSWIEAAVGAAPRGKAKP